MKNFSINNAKLGDMMDEQNYFKPEPVTKEQFLLDNPFGRIFTDQDGPELRALTQEEYDEFVENSRGIWDDK